MEKIVFENIFRSNDVSFNDEGIAVCPYCNGTGLNAEFNLFNKINEKLRPSVIACCLKCYGKKKTDWVEVTNGRIDEVMEYLFHSNRQFIVTDLWFFFAYIYAGYVVPGQSPYQTIYDENEDRWVEETGIEFPGHKESKNKLFYWIDKFNEYSYVKDAASIVAILPTIYMRAPDYELAAEIKCSIIDALALKFEDLISIEKDLNQLGYTIEDLNDIDIIDESGKKIEIEFNFTWENLLDKFKLPRVHKYSIAPEGVLTVD